MTKQHRLYPTTEVILRMLRAAAERGEQVTIRQLGEAAGLSSSSTVASHLFKLEALELAQRDRAGRWSAANVAPPDERCRNHLRAALEALADVESEQVFAARESLEAALAIVEARE